MKINPAFEACRFFLTVVFLAGLGWVAPASANLSASYLVDLNTGTASRLGSLGGSYSDAYGVNDTGRVVGTAALADPAEDGPYAHAFITGPRGMGIRDLGSLGWGDSIAYGINNAGQVVGTATPMAPLEVASFYAHAFITGPDGVGMRDLGPLHGTSFARDINASGQVVGGFSTVPVDYPNHAFITGPNGIGMRDLGSLGGGTSRAYGVNDTGQVAGVSATAYSSSHAFITGPDGVGLRDLGTLGGGWSEANAINATGQVVGKSHTADGSTHAFITGRDGAGMRDLGTLGGDQSWAHGINDAGQVVGWSFAADGRSHAFITGPDGAGMTDLNSLVDLPSGVIFVDAQAINNAGQVVATALVPEPEGYTLFLGGLALIGFMARRKRAQNLAGHY